MLLLAAILPEMLSISISMIDVISIRRKGFVSRGDSVD